MGEDEEINERWSLALVSYTLLLAGLQILSLPLLGFTFPYDRFTFVFVTAPIVLVPAELLSVFFDIQIWNIFGSNAFRTLHTVIYTMTYVGFVGKFYFRRSEKVIHAIEVFILLNIVVFVFAGLIPTVPFYPAVTLLYVVIMGIGIYLAEMSGDRWILSLVNSRTSSPNREGDTPSNLPAVSDNDRSTSVSQNNTPSHQSDEILPVPDTDISDQRNLFDVVNDLINKGDNLQNEVTDYNRDGKYGSALDINDEAKKAYEMALERASESTLIDSAEIEKKLTAVEDARQEIHHQRLRETVESVESEFNHAESLADRGSLAEARETLVDLESDLISAKQTAIQHNFVDIRDEVATLEQRREERLTDIAERLQAHPIPADIPRVPTVSVDYDALTNEEPIGGGGNADVSKATLPTSDGDVTLAIKEPRMSGTLSTDQVERMLAEAETWDKLDDHDHIVGVVDYGSKPIPWIAMEYMDGGHLGERSGVMDFPQALWTAIAVTTGVRHAHRRGVAHLDLKPENVLFRTVEDAWDIPKVADWGLSKHLLDHSKSIKGYTPTYSAPEQLDDDYGQPDDITDVYQLGTVFYELFTGRPPFDGDSTGQIIRQVLTEEPTPPSEVADVPDGLDNILLTALAKQKTDRYDDIVYLRDDLQDLFEER